MLSPVYMIPCALSKITDFISPILREKGMIDCRLNICRVEHILVLPEAFNFLENFSVLQYVNFFNLISYDAYTSAYERSLAVHIIIMSSFKASIQCTVFGTNSSLILYCSKTKDNRFVSACDE